MRLHARDHGECILVDRENSVHDARPLYEQGTYEAFVVQNECKLVPLPPAESIENYHQFAKVFEREIPSNVTGITKEPLYPSQEFWVKLAAGYKDKVPHRHKFPDIKQKNKNVPLFSLRSDSKGQWKKYSYVESRVFYCQMYEKRAPQTREFQELKRRLQEGYNLEILGYDAYPITQTLLQHYQDPTRPFGHELVLYCLLTIEDPKDFPWNVGFSSPI
jgi:hypothetical protein